MRGSWLGVGQAMQDMCEGIVEDVMQYILEGFDKEPIKLGILGSVLKGSNS